MKEDVIKKKKSLLSRLSMVRSDLESTKPEDFSKDIRVLLERIKNDIQTLISKIIPEVKDEI